MQLEITLLVMLEVKSILGKNWQVKLNAKKTHWISRLGYVYSMPHAFSLASLHGSAKLCYVENMA